VRKAAALLDLDVVEIAGDERGRLTGVALGAGITDGPVCAAVASAGATNTGAVDELDAIADVCADAGLWLHVDAAYGGAALCLPEWAGFFAGVERCDSIVIDPHKWLFSPLDCAALVYRRPALAARTHRQSAGYLNAFGDEQVKPVRSRVPPHPARAVCRSGSPSSSMARKPSPPPCGRASISPVVPPR
jgi:L-2,4-diaminobutyrate decarboxylase